MIGGRVASKRVEVVGLIERPRAPAYARFMGQLVIIVSGLFLFALGVVLTLRSGLGLGPWDVLHQGISRHMPLTFGQASQVVGVAVIGIGLALRVRPGLGAVLNMLLIGFFVDRLVAVHMIPLAAPYGLLAQLGMDAAGVLLVGLGSGLYIRAKLGAGPRDGLMLGLHRVTGVRVAVTRGAGGHRRHSRIPAWRDRGYWHARLRPRRRAGRRARLPYVRRAVAGRPNPDASRGDGATSRAARGGLSWHRAIDDKRSMR